MYKEWGPIARVSMGIDRVPDDIIKRMRKVFSKHSVKDIREWGDLLMRNY